MKTNFFSLAAAIFCGACNSNPASNSAANAADTGRSVTDTASPDAINVVKPVPVEASAINDTQFLAKAYNIGVFEIKAARLAKRMSEDKQVKEFASMMLEDHEAMNKDVMALMQKKGCAVPAALPSDLKDIFKDLNSLMAEGFNKKYAEVNVNGHKDAIALFKQVSSTAKDAAVRKLAVDALPTLRKHEEAALTLQAHVNGGKNAAN